MSVIVTLAGLVLVSFFAVVFRGAPYVPTLKKDVERALDMSQLKPGQTIVDLGSGDGRLLQAAAERGMTAIGYELNPFLVLISKWRCRKYGGKVRVYMKDFWTIRLHDDTDGVFVFLAKPFMPKLSQFLSSESQRLKRPLVLVSYGFELPGHDPEYQDKALIRYKIRP